MGETLCVELVNDGASLKEAAKREVEIEGQEATLYLSLA
jgi:hypothetical protein